MYHASDAIHLVPISIRLNGNILIVAYDVYLRTEDPCGLPSFLPFDFLIYTLDKTASIFYHYK